MVVVDELGGGVVPCVYRMSCFCDCFVFVFSSLNYICIGLVFFLRREEARVKVSVYILRWS